MRGWPVSVGQRWAVRLLLFQALAFVAMPDGNLIRLAEPRG
jgi:hypothetical protein